MPLHRMCREILNTCVRNTEEAERATQVAKADTASGRGQGKGVWVMIEESELAKTFRADDKKKVEAQAADANSLTSSSGEDGTDAASALATQEAIASVLETAKACKKELEDVLASTPSASSSPTATPDSNEDLTGRARDALKALSALIEKTADPAKMEEYLGLNDEIIGLLDRFNKPRPDIASIKGLGIQIENLKIGSTLANGHNSPVRKILDEDELETPVTPRADKGKQRAEPEPEEPQLVLTPTIERTAFDDPEVEQDIDASVLDNAESIVSPTDRYVVSPRDCERDGDTIARSRSWVAEEGEIFRKGAVLLTQEEMETEYDSEELRKEVCTNSSFSDPRTYERASQLLDAMVERPPPRTLAEGFEDPIPGTDTPSSPAVSSPAESPKPAPRPYIRRTRSSSSNMSSPSTPTQESLPVLPTVLDTN